LPSAIAHWASFFPCDGITPLSPGTALQLVAHSSEAGTNASSALQAQELIFKQLESAWQQGFWSMDLEPTTSHCGNSNLAELSMPITEWRRKHQDIDAFCHFENHALWFQGAGAVTDYNQYGRACRSCYTESSCICEYLGEGNGPSRSITYDAGTITWNHIDHCVDLIDDPYCYSLGWMKNQRLDGRLMSNYSAWKALGVAECEAIQEEFDFQPEEVTVGRHVALTPFYFKGAYCALYGNCAPITQRLHKMHVYTKCLLGDAAPEMAYCYYKGCVLPDNRIGHGSECGYDV